jgi:hypothetical protein
MTKVIAGITTSLDGHITGPNDGPGLGLGEGGERLHYWVFGGPWSYDEEPRGEATGADKEFLDRAMERVGAVIGGRNTYEAAEHWGGNNPWPVPFFILTHRPQDEPPGKGFYLTRLYFLSPLDLPVWQQLEPRIDPSRRQQPPSTSSRIAKEALRVLPRRPRSRRQRAFPMPRRWTGSRERRGP